MRIAIVDDGIEASILDEINLVDDLIVDKNGTVRKRDVTEMILTDHGTTCAAIIAKYTKEVDFCSLRIFHHQNMKADASALITALKWCYCQKIPIVHMSLGTCNLCDYSELRDIVSKMIKQGQVIVAAHSNKEHFSLPACIGGVFGVAADDNMIGYQYAIEKNPVNFHMIKASSKHELSFASRVPFLTQLSNSYAAPTITAAIHNIALKHKLLSISKIYAELSSSEQNLFFHKPDFINNAYIFNPHREHILKKHLFFNCIAEYNELPDLTQIHQEKRDLVLLSSSDIKSMSESAFQNELTPHQIQYQCNSGLFWRSDIYKNTITENCSKITDEKRHAETDGLEYPIVKVFGTYPNVIDLVCKLNKCFRDDGYQCVTLCDHHLSSLYGLEYIPPNIERQNAILYFDNIYSLDIMICCFQTETLPEILNPDEFYVVLDCYRGDRLTNDARNIISVTADDVQNSCCNDIFCEILSYFDE